MTTPTPQLADTAQQHTQQLRALETAVAAAATTALAARLTEALRDATAAWLRAAGNLTTTPSRPELAKLIAEVRRRITAAMAGQATRAQHALEDGTHQATSLGARQAARFATTARGTPVPVPPTPEPGDDTQQAIDDIPRQVAEQQHAALKALTVAAVATVGWAGITAAFNHARRAAARIAAAVSTAMGTAAANGARALVTELDRAADEHPGRKAPRTLLMWVAEPDACPACAAYSGRTIKPGEKFPGGLSLNPRRSVFREPVTGPPRHPHCRCVLIPWRHEWARPGASLTAVLRNRARTRST